MNAERLSTQQVLDTVRQHWDAAAASYDQRPGHGLSEEERWAWRRVLGRTLEPLQGRAPLAVLDVGTGTGEMAMILANMGLRVSAVDLSPKMLDQASRKAQALGIPIETRLAAADTLPFADSSFDVVFSRHLFWTLPDPQAAVKEWTRVVRPGGVVAIADGWWAEPGAIREARRAMGKLLRRVFEPEEEGSAHLASVAAALPVAGGVSPYSIRYYLDAANLERIRVRDLQSIRRAERRVRPLWHRVDQARYTWLATGYRP